jgi:hypothetical protein
MDMTTLTRRIQLGFTVSFAIVLAASLQGDVRQPTQHKKTRDEKSETHLEKALADRAFDFMGFLITDREWTIQGAAIAAGNVPVES